MTFFELENKFTIDKFIRDNLIFDWKIEKGDPHEEVLSSILNELTDYGTRHDVIISSMINQLMIAIKIILRSDFVFEKYRTSIGSPDHSSFYYHEFFSKLHDSKAYINYNVFTQCKIFRNNNVYSKKSIELIQLYRGNIKYPFYNEIVKSAIFDSIIGIVGFFDSTVCGYPSITMRHISPLMKLSSVERFLDIKLEDFKNSLGSIKKINRRVMKKHSVDRPLDQEKVVSEFLNHFYGVPMNDILPSDIISLLKFDKDFLKKFLAFASGNRRIYRKRKEIQEKWISSFLDLKRITEVIEELVVLSCEKN